MEDLIKCKKCGLEKPHQDYYWTKTGALNRKECKSCISESGKQVYRHEQRYQILKAWRLAHPEEYAQQQTRAKVKRQERRATDPAFAEHLRAQKRGSAAKNFIQGMLSRARERASKSGLEFTITPEDVAVPTICPLLEIPLERGTKGDYQASPSIDRLDPSKGYIPGNIRVISTLANTMKNAANYQQLMAFSRNIPGYIAPLNLAA